MVMKGPLRGGEVSFSEWSTTCGRELIQQPSLSRGTPLILEIDQEVPVRVQYAGLAEPVDMLLRREVMELQALDLAPQPRGQLPLPAQEVLHHPNRLQLFLERA